MVRKLNLAEEEIMSQLLQLANMEVNLKALIVKPLDDGGMGSLAFGPNHENRMFGRQASEYTFEDSDGTKVLATLYLDKEGEIYELDVWKVDFSPTQRLK
ncbi:DUF6984 family protein [Colwellia sp. RE-S-Sl-9]